MIIVKIELFGAQSGRIDDLGTLIIDNIGGTRTRGNYRCRAYRKGEIKKAGSGWGLPLAKPIREGFVHDHPRLAEPVQSLVLKAFKALNYGESE